MTTFQEFIENNNFSLNVLFIRSDTNKVVMTSNYDNCYTTMNTQTGYTEIRVKNRVYLVYDRLNHDDKIVLYHPKSNTLYITFYI